MTQDLGPASLDVSSYQLADVPLLVSFYVQYPDPIGLPDLSAHVMLSEDALEGYDTTTVLHAKPRAGGDQFMLVPEISRRLFTSFRFFQRPITSPADAQMTAMREFLADVIPQQVLIEPEAAQPSGFPPVYETWLEMTTPVVAFDESRSVWTPVAVELSDQLLGRCLDRCFEQLTSVVRGYRVGFKVTMRALNIRRARELIIVTLRKHSEEPQAGDDSHLVVNFSSGELARLMARPPQVPPVEMNKVIAGLRVGALHPGFRVLELEADATCALRYDGEFRGGLLLQHAAGEALLDLALAAMMYETGDSAAHTASIFERGLVARIKSQYSQRLGGDWDINATGACGRWFRNLVQVRNRVIHSAYMPDTDEVAAAALAYEDFKRYLLDRITTKIGSYPFTAAICVSGPSLERRGVSAARISAVMARADESGLSAFNDWYAQLTAARELA